MKEGGFKLTDEEHKRIIIRSSIWASVMILTQVFDFLVFLILKLLT